MGAVPTTSSRLFAAGRPWLWPTMAGAASQARSGVHAGPGVSKCCVTSASVEGAENLFRPGLGSPYQPRTGRVAATRGLIGEKCASADRVGGQWSTAVSGLLPWCGSVASTRPVRCGCNHPLLRRRIHPEPNPNCWDYLRHMARCPARLDTIPACGRPATAAVCHTLLGRCRPLLPTIGRPTTPNCDAK